MAINRPVLGRKPLFVYLSLALALVIRHSGAIAEQNPHEFAAVLSTVNFGHGNVGDCIEMIALTHQSTNYVFAIDYPEPSFCSPLPGECSIVLWGHSGIPRWPDSLRLRNKELFNALMKLKPFQLKKLYPRLSNSGAMAWFDIKKWNSSGDALQKSVIAEGYYQFDEQNEFYRVFDYMRSLKKDIIFFPQEYNLRACVRELEKPTFESTFERSPHWKKIKLAMISYLGLNHYQAARPVFERLLARETDEKTVMRLKASLQLLENYIINQR